MKNTMKTLVIIFLSIITFSCDNDDPSTPAPNVNVCNYAGLSFLDTSNNTQTLIPEADLSTILISNFGGSGQTGMQITGATPSGGSVVFSTTAITLNATETTTLFFNGTNYPVTITCQRAGTNVGDEFRFDVTGSGLEIEFCVVMDAIVSNCNTAISYTINGNTTVHYESDVFSEIWDQSNYTVTKNVYDIWTDEGVGFYYHSSASNTGDVSGFVSDWQNNEGSHLVIPGENLSGGNLTFTTTQETTIIGEVVKITFNGTYSGKTITGTICTVIDIYNL